MRSATLIGRVAAFALLTAAPLLAGGVHAGDQPGLVQPALHVDSQAAAWRTCEGLPGCEFLPLRGDAGREASEAIFRLAAGVRFPKHWHTSAEHILVMQGRLEMNLESGQRYSLGPRAFLYNPGGMVHWGSCGGAEPCVYYVYDDRPYDIHLVE